jgi:hypothetical protein
MSKSINLVQALAVQAQINLPGTAGRLLKQIRDLESLAPRFVKAGLVQTVDRPDVLNLRLSGISTSHATERLAGGFLFVSAALRVDLRFENNALATEGTDSVSVVDDIDFVDQSKRLLLIEIRQVYELADRVMQSEKPPQIVLIEGPLMLNRSMVPVSKATQHGKEYERTLETIRQFWQQHQEKLYPWNPKGTIVAGIATERLGAIAAISQQDLRSFEGQQQLLKSDLPAAEVIGDLNRLLDPISGIGQRRFVRGILGSNSRTAAFKMNVQTPRMEPADIVDASGLAGFHYRSVTNSEPLLVQLLGGDNHWTREQLNDLAGLLIAATVQHNKDAVPVPFQLAEHQLQSLRRFLKQYCLTMRQELKNREIENSWLADLETPNS